MSRAKRAGTAGADTASPAAAVVASCEARLFVALAGLFVTNALIAEFVGVRIFALEDTLGVRGVTDMQAAFAGVFGQGLWTIGGSVTAFLVDSFIVPCLGPRLMRAWLARPAASPA